jgi:hypothetical protein
LQDAIECTSYAQLLDVLRARKNELNISFETLDALSGLQNGYSAKLIGPSVTRRLGEVSLGCLLGALCLKLTVQPDPVALARIKHRLTPRKASFAHSRPAAEPAGALIVSVAAQAA